MSAAAGGTAGPGGPAGGASVAGETAGPGGPAGGATAAGGTAGAGRPGPVGAAGEPLDLLYPAYGRASLADVLPGVLAALGVPGVTDPLDLAGGALHGVDRVALLMVDGLGWHQLHAARRFAPALAGLVAGDAGAPARVLTTGFPSTTPTSLVSLGTGVPPGAHGVLGFNVLIPGTDRVLTHIAWRGDPAPTAWQPVPPLPQVAAAAGVAVTSVGPGEFDGSGLTTAAYGRTRYRPAATLDDLAAGVVAALAEGPGLVYGYHGGVDRAGHVHGWTSPEWAAAVAGTDALLARLVDALRPGWALVVTADHGMLDVPPHHRVDLVDRPDLRAGLRAVAGEPRARYLHPVAGAAGDVLAAWRDALGDTAWVAPREEVVEAGWFGPVPDAHLPRIGEVVAVSLADHAVFATGYEPAATATLVGMHGGPTRVEMQIPLLVARG
jgi:hypothetical protein